MNHKLIIATVVSLLILAIAVSLLPEGELKANILFFGAIGIAILVSGGLIVYGVKGVYDYLIDIK